MIDVGRQSTYGYAGMPLRDPTKCVRDMCRQPLSDESVAFCDDCLAYMRGDE